MSGSHLLAYVLATLLAGISCLGILLVLARQPDSHLARAFVPLHIALGVLMVGGLLIVFDQTQGDDGSIRFPVEYVESFIGRYAVLFFLPFFAHRLFAIQSRARDGILLVVVSIAFLGQHVTEYVLGGLWDDYGDLAEDMLAAAIIAYTLALGFVRLNAVGVDRPLAVRFLFLLGINVPGIAHDVFFADGTAVRFYPLLYCLMSIVMTAMLVSRRSASAAEAAKDGRSHASGVGIQVPVGWDLSGREEEIALLIGRGLSNKQIAQRLDISPNTVKTHMAAIFDKSGVRTRLGLLALLAGAQNTEPSGDPKRRG